MCSKFNVYLYKQSKKAHNFVAFVVESYPNSMTEMRRPLGKSIKWIVVLFYEPNSIELEVIL